MFTELTGHPKVVGIRQVKRVVSSRQARRVFLAEDADPRVTGPIAALCAECGVEIETAGTMRALGTACGISVGAAVAALLE